MRNCYRALLVFAPAMDDPQLVAQFNQLKAHAPDVKSRDLLYVPIVPEGHNQPIPGSRIHTASGTLKMQCASATAHGVSNRLIAEYRLKNGSA